MSHSGNGGRSRQDSLNQVIAGYLEALQSGRAPDRAEFLKRHAEFSTELELFFANHDQMRRLAGSAPPARPSTPERLSSTDLKQFLHILSDSNLLSSDQLAAVSGRSGYNGAAITTQDVGERLIEQGLLTRWQIQMLLAGRNAFFLGKYKLLEVLGHGGMGAVFKAEHTILRRMVAIKILAPDLMKAPEAVARFRHEARAVAALSHPNIVSGYDADYVGETHFLVMEYVEGLDLESWFTEYKGRAIPVGVVCEFVRQAALGLQHAHERGMVHRDVKPANILLTQDSRDEPPVVKILDLGLSRFVSESVEDSSLTRTGQIMGTPEYISPEQARNTRQADIRSDIYSLGCTLFRLLAGRPPFDAINAVESITARVTEEPPRLCTVRSDVSDELDAVVARMMARLPENRYQTPAEVADALAPFTTDSAKISIFPNDEESSPGARRVSPETSPESLSVETKDVAWEATDLELDKYLSHLSTHTSAVDGADAAVPSHTSAPFDTPSTPENHFLRSIDSSNERGQESQKREPSAKRIIRTICVVAALLIGVVYFFVSRSTEFGLVVGGEENQAPIDGDDRRVALTASTSVTNQTAADKARANSADALYDGEVLRFEGHTAPVNAIAISGDGRYVLSCAKDETIRLWDAATGGEIRQLAGHEGYITCLAISPDSRHGLTGSWDTTARLWDLETGATVRQFVGHQDRVQAVAFSEDMKHVLSSSYDRTMRLWDFETGKEIQSFYHEFGEKPLEIRAVLFSHDATMFFSGCEDGSIRVWNRESEKEVRRFAPGHERVVNCMVLSPDGRSLLSASTDSTLHHWDIASGTSMCVSHGYWETVPVVTAAFSPDGRQFVSGAHDVSLRFWDSKTCNEIHRLNAKTSCFIRVAFAPDGQHVLSAGGFSLEEMRPDGDYALHLWRVPAH